MQNKVLFGIGALLIIVGIYKPQFYIPIINPNPTPVSNILEHYITDVPENPELLKIARDITKILIGSNDNNRKNNCLKLSSLYADLDTLISLHGDDMVIKDTASIREANRLTGIMLRLDMKNKYPGLSAKCEELMVAAIGSDEALLDNDLRNKGREASEH